MRKISSIALVGVLLWAGPVQSRPTECINLTGNYDLLLMECDSSDLEPLFFAPFSDQTPQISTLPFPASSEIYSTSMLGLESDGCKGLKVRLSGIQSAQEGSAQRRFVWQTHIRTGFRQRAVLTNRANHQEFVQHYHSPIEVEFDWYILPSLSIELNDRRVTRFSLTENGDLKIFYKENGGKRSAKVHCLVPRIEQR